MASQANQQCANCIGTFFVPFRGKPKASVRPSVRLSVRSFEHILKWTHQGAAPMRTAYVSTLMLNGRYVYMHT